MKKVIALGLPFVLILGIGFVSCTRWATRRAERKLEKTCREDTGDIAISFDEKLPADFPHAQDLVYPDAKIVTSFTVNFEEGYGEAIFSETTASFEDVRYFYENLACEEWTVDATMEIATEESDGYMIIFSKGDFDAIVTIDEEEGKTIISIVYGKECP